MESTADVARCSVALRSLLRQEHVCNYPSQLLGDGGYRPADSGKLLRLAEVCEELAERQEKVLGFTRFREIIDSLAEHLTAVFGWPGLVLHGGTGVKKRRGLVSRIQSDGRAGECERTEFTYVDLVPALVRTLRKSAWAERCGREVPESRAERPSIPGARAAPTAPMARHER